MPASSNPSFMSGVPEILILKLLSTREMYGYEIVQAIETATGRRIKLGEGVVYPVLHALETRECVRARRKPVQGRTRVYYTITAAGRRRLGTLEDEWTRIAEAVSQVLRGGGDAFEPV